MTILTFGANKVYNPNIEYIICRLQYIDKIFGNENFLREVEEDILDLAAAKSRMKRIGSVHDLKLLRERMNLRSHLGGALELKVELDGVIGKYTSCIAIGKDIITTLSIQLIPRLRSVLLCLFIAIMV